MSKYMIINHQNNFLHILVHAVLLHARSLLKNTDSNIIEILPKISLFPEGGQRGVYHRSYMIEKQLIKYGNIPLGVHFNLRFSNLKSDS